MLVRTHFEDRESWLDGRGVGIGGSEAAAVLGLSPWLSSVRLWEQKTGQKQAKNISDNPSVARGVAVEDPMRRLFYALHPEMILAHYPYDLLYQDNRPWLFATLDGELREKETGKKGILEIKSGDCIKRADWEAWDNKIPEHYYVQGLHQLLATGWDFVCFFAILFNAEGDASLRSYRFDRAEVLQDMDYLLGKETAFWESVTKKEIPAMRLPQI